MTVTRQEIEKALADGSLTWDDIMALPVKSDGLMVQNAPIVGTLGDEIARKAWLLTFREGEVQWLERQLARYGQRCPPWWMRWLRHKEQPE